MALDDEGIKTDLPPCVEHICQHHFSNSICSLCACVCHILVILAIFQTLQQQTNYNMPRAQMVVSNFSNKKFKN